MSENTPSFFSSFPLIFHPNHTLYVCDKISLLRNHHLLNTIEVKNCGVAWPNISSKWDAPFSKLSLAVRVNLWLKMLHEVGTPKIWFMTSSAYSSKFNVQHPHQRNVITAKYRDGHRREQENINDVSMYIEVSVIMLIEESPASLMGYTDFYLEGNLEETANLNIADAALLHTESMLSKPSYVLSKNAVSAVHEDEEQSSFHLPQSKFMEFVVNFLEFLNCFCLSIGQKRNRCGVHSQIETQSTHNEFSSGSNEVKDDRVKVESEEDLGVDCIPLEIQCALQSRIPKTAVIGSRRVEPFEKGEGLELLLLECLVCDQTFKGGHKMFPALMKHMKTKHPRDYGNVKDLLRR